MPKPTRTPDPEVIYLEPACCADPDVGRTWAIDKPWTCEDVDCLKTPPTKYIRADVAALQSPAVEWRITMDKFYDFIKQYKDWNEQGSLKHDDKEQKYAAFVLGKVLEQWPLPPAPTGEV